MKEFVFLNTLNFTKIHVQINSTESPVYNNTALMYMYQEKWLGHYKNALGANYWAAYNTLTDWSSHGPQAKKGRRVEQNNIASLNYDRSQKVIAVVKDNFRLAA